MESGVTATPDFFRTPSAEMEQKNMEQYATQMEAARKGIVTEELKKGLSYNNDRSDET